MCYNFRLLSETEVKEVAWSHQTVQDYQENKSCGIENKITDVVCIHPFVWFGVDRQYKSNELLVI